MNRNCSTKYNLQLPPVVSAMDVPSSGAMTTGTSGTFSATAVDPDGSKLSYAWTFGDGGTGTGASVSHAYGASGTYTVGVTVTNAASRSASLSRTVTAAAPSGGSESPNKAPVVSLTLSSLTGLPTDSILGTATAADSDGTIAGYSWSIRKGTDTVATSATGATFGHRFSAAGTYVWSVTARDDKGATTTATKTLVLTAAAPTITTMTVAPSASQKTGDTLTFTASATDPQGESPTYAWSFGDNSTGTGTTGKSQV